MYLESGEYFMVFDSTSWCWLWSFNFLWNISLGSWCTVTGNWCWKSLEEATPCTRTKQKQKHLAHQLYSLTVWSTTHFGAELPFTLVVIISLGHHVQLSFLAVFPAWHHQKLLQQSLCSYVPHNSLRWFWNKENIDCWQLLKLFAYSDQAGTSTN